MSASGAHVVPPTPLNRTEITGCSAALPMQRMCRIFLAKTGVAVPDRHVWQSADPANDWSAVRWGRLNLARRVSGLVWAAFVWEALGAKV
jgi:hypothetical protein